MDENLSNMPLEGEEGIDIVALVKSLWEGKMTIIIWTCAFMVLGLVSVLTMRRSYKVETMMVPQLSSKSTSSLSSLASLAGIDLGSIQTSDLSPIVYPQIVKSVPFQLELIYTPLHYEKVDTAVCLMTYETEIMKPTVFETISTYTIGLPRYLLSLFKKKKEIELPVNGVDENIPTKKPIVITQAEDRILRTMDTRVSLMADKKEGTLTLTVKGVEPIQTAELAMKAQQLLQDEIIRYRTEKTLNDLNYIQARYDEVKAEAESYQVALASIVDRSQNTITTRDRIERERIQAKYNIANSIYSEMAKQLETAKMQVKQDTPTFTIIKPVTVPLRTTSSRVIKLFVWTIFGFIFGCGIIIGKKYYFRKIKDKFSTIK